jgi:hypothetical protein
MTELPSVGSGDPKEVREMTVIDASFVYVA